MATPQTTRVCILIGICLALFLGLRGFLKRPSEPKSSAPTLGVAQRKVGGNGDRESTPRAKVHALIRNSIQNFRSDPAAAQATVLLRSLRDGIRNAPEEEAAAAVVAFLKTGDDAPTRLPFTVGPDGMMEAVPSVRSALLDLLPSLDPVAALGGPRNHEPADFGG